MLNQIILLITFLIADTPNHMLNKNPKKMQLYAHAYIDAGKMYNIDPFILTDWSYRESSFKKNAVGKLKEKGLFQFMKRSAVICKGVHDISTARGQIMCGARIIDNSRTYCGSLERGLRQYASGSCIKAKEKVRRRLKRVEKLKKKIKDSLHYTQ